MSDKIFKDSELYTPTEIGEKLKVTKEAVYRWLKEGKLKAIRVGKYWRIAGKDINEFIKYK